MSHTYLKFKVTKHCSLCIFGPVAAFICHLVTNASYPGVLESSLSFMPHYPSADSGFQIFLESVFSSLFFVHCPSGFHHLLPRQLPQRLTWSLLQACSPQISFHPHQLAQSIQNAMDFQRLQDKVHESKHGPPKPGPHLPLSSQLSILLQATSSWSSPALLKLKWPVPIHPVKSAQGYLLWTPTRRAWSLDFPYCIIASTCPSVSPTDCKLPEGPCGANVFLISVTPAQAPTKQCLISTCWIMHEEQVKEVWFHFWI